ncbi:MAG TPA: AAA family ATPase, partial [Firmicutes bacterium]|nr:AAA family ATPase [Bacillota bacterium]
MPALFNNNQVAVKPLSVLLRPTTINEFIGQEHIIGEGRILRRIITSRIRTNLILWGPPGTGKTTIGHIIASTTDSEFIHLNATTVTVTDLRREILSAINRRRTAKRGTILFIDEIHRLTKTQQDALLPDMEEATINVIGASIHNPFHRLDRALLSRAKVLELKPLTDEDLDKILTNALSRADEWADDKKIEIEEEARNTIVNLSNGDARRVLDTLELIVKSDESKVVRITPAAVEEFMQERLAEYDREGDLHYTVASALIKFMRGSDPDA